MADEGLGLASHLHLTTNSMDHSSFNFPEELITEILLRLPVKPLLRFRSVSKSWLRLISSPKFVRTHLSVCANDKAYTRYRLLLGCDCRGNLKDCSLASLLDGSVTEVFRFEYPIKDDRKTKTIVGSVNGLICFKIAKDFFLWNPSIRKFKKLCDARDDWFSIYGFGYDELHDDYKVVSVCFYPAEDDEGLGHVEGKLYSLNRDSWINIDCFQRADIVKRNGGLLVNGRVHWLHTFLNSHEGCVITSIDLSDGKCVKIEKPCCRGDDIDHSLCLGVLGSELILFCYSSKGYADVWVMKEYGVKESWTKMFTITHLIDAAEFECMPEFCMLNEGEIMFEFEPSFIIYGKKDDSIRYRKIINYDVGPYWPVDTYIESLLWPFAAEGARVQQ